MWDRRGIDDPPAQRMADENATRFVASDQAHLLDQFSDDLAPALPARVELPRPCYLTMTLVCMGGHINWPEHAVAKQAGISAAADQDVRLTDRGGAHGRRR
jgi:hypothetical protein